MYEVIVSRPGEDNTRIAEDLNLYQAELVAQAARKLLHDYLGVYDVMVDVGPE